METAHDFVSPYRQHATETHCGCFAPTIRRSLVISLNNHVNAEYEEVTISKFERQDRE